MHPEPLQTGQDRRQLVPAPEGQANLFDGRDLEIGLGLEGVAHGRKQWRMLQGQTPESPQTFNRSSNIRTLPFASNPMRARSFPALAAHYLTKPVNPVDLISAIKARLGRRQAQRQRQEKQMERAMQLFGGIVHDLRDPLFVVLGYTDILRGGAGKAPSTGENSTQILDRMHQAVLQMQAVISETLFLARSRMQRLPGDPNPLDLREFCEQVLANHEESPRLRFQCAPERFPVTADALRLRQALDNLLSNALKYSDGPVVVRLSASAQNFVIEVSDRGIGIPADEQEAIFEPFFRASNTSGRPGHGLGLSIVKSCIEQHGGSVRFSSDLDRQTSRRPSSNRSSGRRTRADGPGMAWGFRLSRAASSNMEAASVLVAILLRGRRSSWNCPRRPFQRRQPKRRCWTRLTKPRPGLSSQWQRPNPQPCQRRRAGCEASLLMTTR